MQANGRVQITAPKCVAITAVPIRSGYSDGEGNGTVKLFSTVDTTLKNAALVGDTSIVLTEGVGVTDNQLLVVGYGSDNEETVQLGAVSEIGSASANITLTVPALKRAHAANERVVRVLNAIRPGSVVIKKDGVALANCTDTGLGTFTGAGVDAANSRIDYSIGSVVITCAAAPADNTVVTYDADKMMDLPDQGDLSGSGFQKNFFTAKGSRQPIPDIASFNNLGDTKISYFIEVSYNNGRSFTSKGWASAGNRSGEVGNFGRKVVEFPTGQGNIVDAVRIRAGQNSTSNDTIADTETEKRYIWPGVLEVSHAAIINSNGGGN